MFLTHGINRKNLIGSIVIIPNIENIDNKNVIIAEVNNQLNDYDGKEEVKHNSEIGHVVGLTINAIEEVILRVEVASKGSFYITQIHPNNVIFI